MAVSGSPNRPFPTLGEVLTTDSAGRSLYRALVLTLNKKYSDRWQLQANWVISDGPVERRQRARSVHDPLCGLPRSELGVQPLRPAQPAPCQRLRLVGSAGRRADRRPSCSTALPTRQRGPTSWARTLNNDNHANDRRFVNGAGRRPQPAGEGQPLLHHRPADLEGLSARPAPDRSRRFSKSST